MAQQGITKGTATGGTTHNVATYEQTENAVLRQVQRMAINDQNFNDLTSASAQTAPSAITLTTADTAYIVVPSGAKVGWFIHNWSDTETYMGFHSSVAVANGIRVYPGQGVEQRGIGLFTGDVYMVCASASKVVRRQVW